MIETAKPVIVLQGVLFEDEATELAARRVMMTSMLLVVVFTVETIISLATAESVYDAIGVPFEPGYVYTSIILASLLVCTIPCCGYVGARDGNSGLLVTAAFFSGCCCIYASFGVITAFVSVSGFEGRSCSLLREVEGLERFEATCYVDLALTVITIPLFAANAAYANDLYAKSQTVVIGGVTANTVAV